MTKQQILSEVTNGNWQPEFEFTDSLDKAVDSILKRHEDYFLGLHDEVKEIIQRNQPENTPCIIHYKNEEKDSFFSSLKEQGFKRVGHNKKKDPFILVLPTSKIFYLCDGYSVVDEDEGGTYNKQLKEYIIEHGNNVPFERTFFNVKDFIEWINKNTENITITFGDVCNWQKELFEHKEEIYDKKLNEAINNSWKNKIVELRNLPNKFISLGLRTNNVKVGNWIPPHPIFLEELKEMCFPISVSQTNDCKLHLGGTGRLFYSFPDDYTNQQVLDKLTQWYKVFQTIHYFSDLNGRVGGIIINIVSYLLTGKYLINKKDV